jgi:purine-nucleoside phosphorylase
MASFTELETACRGEAPIAAIVLGSGLANVAARVKTLHTVSFADVPGLPPSGVAGHKGRLSLGEWAGRRVLLFEGRIHFYEGQPWEVVERPMHVAVSLHAPIVLLTNAAGGIRDDLAPGSLMAIQDHLECNRPGWWRAPPLPSPYSPRLLDLLAAAASRCSIPLARGAYAATTGPCYETPAEVRALRSWGADAVGMSTTREARAARELGLEVAALSLITNRAAGLSNQALHHEEVLQTAKAAAARLGELLETVVALLASPAR